MQFQIEPRASTSYHRDMIENGLLMRLQQFVVDVLSPQLPVPAVIVDGTITPCFNEDRYCGPSSAVKDTYRLEIRFLAASEVLGTFKEEIEDDLRSHTFRARYRHRKLFVITQAQRAAQDALGTVRIHTGPLPNSHGTDSMSNDDMNNIAQIASAHLRQGESVLEIRAIGVDEAQVNVGFIINKRTGSGRRIAVERIARVWTVMDVRGWFA